VRGKRNRRAVESSSYPVVVDDNSGPNHGESDHDEAGDDVRTRILIAANALIASGGTDAATTRAVAVAAAVQAPTIYRLFGDKRGLLDAAAEHGLAAFVADKALHKSNGDPVEDLRRGWDLNIEFGVANPGLFSIMSSDPHLRKHSPALEAGTKILRRNIDRVALAGRLRVSAERAVALMQSVGVGTVLTLLGQSSETRDRGLSVAARDAVIAAITGESTAGFEAGVHTSATTLRASLDEVSVLSKGEQHLLDELLTRIANSGDGVTGRSAQD
jgi:AcrR family transcriptional regulator